jgi:hypothetical protein
VAKAFGIENVIISPVHKKAFTITETAFSIEIEEKGEG